MHGASPALDAPPRRAAGRLSLAQARAAVATVVDPELPFLTLDDLGIVRDIKVDDTSGTVTVTITPTYSACPAMAAIKADIHAALARLGAARIEVHTQLRPAWSTDWMTDRARQALTEHGYSAPAAAAGCAACTMPLNFGMPARELHCPHCGSAHTRRLAEHGSTLCKALYACVDCGEPFEHFKEVQAWRTR